MHRLLKEANHQAFLLNVVSMVNIVFGEALFLFKDDPKWQGRTGAYFCLADNNLGGLPTLLMAVGEVSAEKAEKYLSFSQEKARRTWENGQLSSWLSRNPDENKWGGAIRSNMQYIYSMSGLPEHGDEAVMLATAWATHRAGLSHLDNIANLSNNPYWEQLKKFLSREI